MSWVGWSSASLPSPKVQLESLRHKKGADIDPTPFSFNLLQDYQLDTVL